MWKCIRNLLPSKNESLPYTFSIDNQLCSNDFVIANAFNDYFINSVINLNDKDMNCIINNEEPFICSHSFDFTPVDDNFVIELISNLDESKATGADDISIRLLKEGNPSIVPWITQFINFSFSTGVYPNDWKHGKICPLFKKGDRNICTNYRPISILSAASKLIERVAHKQLYHYVVKNGLLNKTQFGFRPGHSTGAALGSMVDEWLHSIDIGRIIAALYVDLKQAFDTVDPSIMLLKLKRKGVGDLALQWFKSYLTNRTQQVAVRGTMSNKNDLSLGVPQGSILGPLLFLLYIDDMVNVISHGKVTMYADDTTLYVSGTSLNDIQFKLQEDLIALKNWIQDNRLHLNVGKTKLMILGSKQRLRSLNNDTIYIEYDGNPIERCSSIKCLGVIIDENLLFHDHVDSVCKKVFAGLAVLRRIKPFIDDYTLKLLYMCIVQSQIDYCCEIWGNRLNMHTERITKLQKRAARLILNCNMYTSSKGLFLRLKWLPFKQRVQYFRCLFVYKCINNISSDFYSDVFKPVSEIHQINTRSSSNNNLAVPKCHTEYYTHALCCSGSILWNKLPVEIRQKRSIESFKKMLKQYYCTLAFEEQ